MPSRTPQTLPPAFVPPYLLSRLAEHASAPVSERAVNTLTIDREHRALRGFVPPAVVQGTTAIPPRTARPNSPERAIYDAGHKTMLPGKLVRTEGRPATGDIAADEAYDHLGATWRLYHDVYERDSIDGASMPLTGSVHYGKDYDNAFWNGTQMVFGDGDGEVMNRFTIAVDIIGHELTHGVIDHEAALVYQGQPGALNESICDVFGVLVKQHVLKQTAQQADWLVGAGLFMPTVKAKALRSMAEPGTAYDDPVIGARRTAFESRVPASACCAFAASAAARAASSADRASSSCCWVARPASFSFTVRSSSRAARFAPASAWRKVAFAACTPASTSRESRRARASTSSP